MILYRYVRAENHAVEDMFFTHYVVQLEKHTVIRETDKCYVVFDYYKNKERFILKTQYGKRFAYTTQAAALSNFIARTERCMKIADSARYRASMYLMSAKKLVGNLCE